MIKKQCRYTVVDGRVTTFALDFEAKAGILTTIFEPTGPIIVSASMSKVIIEEAAISNGEEESLLLQMVELANAERKYLKKWDGRPPDNWDGEPKDLTFKSQT